MRLSRRRFLSIASAAALAAPAAAHAFRWQGTAIGAKAQIVLDHPRAAEITARALTEIDRLEDIFSLYRPGSALNQLNANGHLPAPPFELLECLATARRAHSLTGGRFDPSVQPLWQVLAEAWAEGHPPAEAELIRARRLIGFDRVRFDSAAVTLGPKQALTLNGIAQGYIADRIANLMRGEGVTDVLIDTGEISALGTWPVEVANSQDRLSLTNRALATSAHIGTTFDAAGRVGHILDPAIGEFRHPVIASLSISARDAAFADALSTGLILSRSREEIVSTLRNLKDTKLESISVQ